ncbi:Hsp70-binding protein 1 [Nymphon striatum]|nr:Hsp70-binding protein 1 [Nymphon striatum]
MSGEDSNRVNRNPRNIQGLLRIAAENTDQDSQADPNRSYAAMSQERREFLANAVSSLTSDVQVMKECLKVVVDSTEEISKQVNAIENIAEIVENLDSANDFVKIGGLSVITPILKNNKDIYCELRWQTADLFAVILQNNPFCQEAALNEKNQEILPLLLTCLKSEENPMVRIKCLHAISCFIRGNVEAQKKFLEADGLSFLIKAIQSDNEKLRIKSCFLITYLCEENSSVKDILSDMGIIELLINLLHMGQNNLDEHLLSAILSTVNNHEQNRNECTRSELDLKRILIAKIESLKDKEENMVFELHSHKFNFFPQEEFDYSKTLLNLCFPVSNNDGTER